MQKKLAFFGGLVGAGAALATLVAASASHAGERHSAIAAPPMGQISDLYAWMDADGAKLDLIMDVSAFDDGTNSFGPDVQYVFHAMSTAAFGGPATDTKVICTFTSNTSAQCWVGTHGYIAGDPSVTSGVASTDGKIRLFAGRRSDPAFWNLGGFQRAVATYAGDGAAVDDAKCPALGSDAVGAIHTALTTAPPAAVAPCPANQVDCFAAGNVMAIVLQVDRSLLTSNGNTILEVWGATHAAPAGPSGP